MNILHALLLMVTTLQISTCQDPCKQHADLNYGLKRSSAYMKANNELSICDSTLIENTWYRMVNGAGDDMATECPPVGRCGTTFPIWMNGSVPNAQQGIVNRTVHRRNLFGCSQTSWTIQIKNCGNFSVYHLPPADACPSAYCFGSVFPCPPGESSESGNVPCSSNFPADNLSAHVTVKEVEGVGMLQGHGVLQYQIGFSCIVHGASMKVQFYDFYWYINGEEVVHFKGVAEDNFTSADLREIHWAKKYKLGMLVTPREVVVEEGKTVNVIIETTVPVGCINFTAPGGYTIQRRECVLSVKSYYQSPGDDQCHQGVKEGTIVLGSSCGVNIQSGPGANQSDTLSITGYRDGVYNSKDRQKFLYLKTAHSFHDVMNGIVLPEVKITVTDKDAHVQGKYCHSNNDPYCRTTHGQGWPCHAVGQFILYKHKHFPVEVQVVYAMCARRGDCNCAIIIRSYSSLFIVNVCPEKISHEYEATRGRTNNYIEERGCDEKHMVIEGTNPRTVTLPTGTKVKFRINTVSGSKWISEISIAASPSDFQNQGGLCGHFGDNWQDDFMLPNGTVASNTYQFMDSWRIRNGSKDDLLSPQVDLDSSETRRHYCTCARRSSDWANLDNEIHCNLTSAMELCRQNKTNYQSYLQTCGGVQKRDLIKYDDDIDYYPLQIDVDHTGSQPAVWTGNMTEEKARQICQGVFARSKILDLCLKHTNFSTTNYIEACVLDIKYTGGTDWTAVSLEVFHSLCHFEMSRMEILKETYSASGKSVMDEFLMNICPMECSYNGECNQGVCQCTDGYVDNDCSIKKSIPPSHISLSQSGLCNIRKRPCHSTLVFATNLPEESPVHCKTSFFEIRDSEIYQDNQTTVREAEHFYLGVVRCLLPKHLESSDVLARGFRISLSNDGINFSEEVLLIIYDAMCYTCFSNTTCKKTGSCEADHTTTTGSATTYNYTTAKQIRDENTTSQSKVQTNPVTQSSDDTTTRSGVETSSPHTTLKQSSDDISSQSGVETASPHTTLKQSSEDITTQSGVKTASPHTTLKQSSDDITTQSGIKTASPHTTLKQSSDDITTQSGVETASPHTTLKQPSENNTTKSGVKTVFPHTTLKQSSEDISSQSGVETALPHTTLQQSSEDIATQSGAQTNSAYTTVTKFSIAYPTTTTVKQFFDVTTQTRGNGDLAQTTVKQDTGSENGVGDGDRFPPWDNNGKGPVHPCLWTIVLVTLSSLSFL